MKLIAWYLPQFHRIDENDKWWGKGFTEWTNVRKAKPLFKKHMQPRIPLNENYYNLTDVETIRWQSMLAKKYGIYGFCFYHYWFEGKMLLEKPIEILYQNKNIDINYCMSWANETWARTWDGKEKEVLQKQTYGASDDWDSHYRYFSKYFKDRRYIKIDNKPMLLLYKTGNIQDCKLMMDYFIKEAINDGFNGIHFVETVRNNKVDNREIPISARAEFEPARTNNKLYLLKWSNRLRRSGINIINKVFNKNFIGNKLKDYSYFVKKSCNIKITPNTYAGVFTGWDNTPRMGSKGTVFINNTSTKFYDYMKEKYGNSKYNKEFMFINAWNEWAEGAYLEPDKINKYAFLEAVRKFKDEIKNEHNS